MKDGETSQDSSQVWRQDESSSGDEDSPQCPICLARLKSQDVGTPDTCDHTFCLDCLLEWSKVSEGLFTHNVFNPRMLLPPLKFIIVPMVTM